MFFLNVSLLQNILCPVHARPVHRKQNIKQQQKILNKKLQLYLLGDSMVKHQKGWDIGKAAGHRVVVKAFFRRSHKRHDSLQQTKYSSST
jgi:hypothetical protein